LNRKYSGSILRFNSEKYRSKSAIKNMAIIVLHYLSPSNPDNILEDEIKIVYNGMEFPLGVDMSEQTMSKAYLAILSGLDLGKYGNDYYLIFGEFDGANNWNDSFEIYWGDGTSDKISFTRNFKWDNNGNPDISNEALYLNNKKVEDKLIIIR
ncbi:MAG: hypothetical protein R3Y50_04575, partial [Rikenellaceae bacterium]